MNSKKTFPNRTGWVAKFAAAFRGVQCGICGQNSFTVHFTITLLVIIAATLLQVNRLEWCLLIISIAGVLTTELFNSALEAMALAIDTDFNSRLADALDIASGAVLIAAVGAAGLGLLVLGTRLWILLQAV